MDDDLGVALFWLAVLGGIVIWFNLDGDNIVGHLRYQSRMAWITLRCICARDRKTVIFGPRLWATRTALISLRWPPMTLEGIF
jgi:hypothetical protein